MAKIHTEDAFETLIETHLLKRRGYRQGNPATFDREKALFPDEVIEFIQTTQPKEWANLEKIYKDDAPQILINDLVRALNSDHEGCLSVLRHGFKCGGKRFKAVYFAPASGLNPQIQAWYDANILTVTRQVHYSTKNENSLDLVISLNGIPVLTAELKNPLTGQTWRNAIHQYRQDRNPDELIFQFKKRALVHFAVDPDEVHMTTRLRKTSTFFLPFNMGYFHGAGNPPNPSGHKTAYLWEKIFQRDVLLDILARYMHLEVEEKKVGDKTIKRETMIFPRFHQLDAVNRMVMDAKVRGVGQNYLIQHSAGSGKSNSIAWLAHRLASLHNVDDEKVFDTVVVVTDRRVLDQQLQNTIYQIEHKEGVVVLIKEGESKSIQLAKALESGSPIIITTLQTFPFVTDKIAVLPKRRYAVIVDEAHSSQGGEGVTEMKGVLAGSEKKADDEDADLSDVERQILETIRKRGRQPNLSFFAFTATPKYKTLKVFGQEGPDGKPIPFHLYSMRQAIEERFILDVLQNYTTYKLYYKLIKSVEDNPKLDKRKAARALARFMSLHPHNIAQKAEVMVEHFRTHVKHLIGGRAKAMVVTSSRMHAVRYKQAFDTYIKDKGYKDIRTLVAFSGTVQDDQVPNLEYTEVAMNDGIKERELPEKFGTNEYHVLIVAEKYQTGFDQPLLHTMYVDKRLSGIQAVQTLSRLNRMHAGKESTFVLDFVNDPVEIRESFQPYYETTLVGEDVSVEQLNELQAKLIDKQVFTWAEVEEFSRVFYKPASKRLATDHAQLYKCIDPAVARFKELPEEEHDEIRKELVAFKNLYSFMAQIIPFPDTELEMLYSYVRFLIQKLPKRGPGFVYDLTDDVSLKYYRLQKIAENQELGLIKGEGGVVDSPSDVGTGSVKGDEIELSKLIDLINERFGTDFTPADQLFFDSIREDAVADEKIREAALANTEENFSYVLLKLLDELFIGRMEQNEEIAAKYFNEAKFRKLIGKYLVKQVYKQVREEKQ
jgi:type I restriction enzyme, R subunit